MSEMQVTFHSHAIFKRDTKKLQEGCHRIKMQPVKVIKRKKSNFNYLILIPSTYFVKKRGLFRLKKITFHTKERRRKPLLRVADKCRLCFRFHTQLSGPGIETMDWSTCGPPLCWVLGGGRRGPARGKVPGGFPIPGGIPGRGRVDSLACPVLGSVDSRSLDWPALGNVPSFVCRIGPSDTDLGV